MALDARVRYTKMVIKNSFLHLLKENPINKITVKSICDLAQINRATFYKYYSDPFHLIEQIEQEQLAELQDLVKNSYYDNTEKTFEQILTRMQENIEIYSVLFSEHGDSRFPARIFSVCYETISDNMEETLVHLSDVEREWFYYFIAYGCSGILNCWLKDGMKQPPAQVAAYMSGLSDRLMKSQQ